jgi:dihydroorotase
MMIEKATNVLLKGARVVDPITGLDGVRDIRLSEGMIVSIEASLKSSADERLIDLSGCVIAPGFIDMHVHFREPGFEHKETIMTGCAAAAAGGFTAVCCMPNTNPPIDDEAVVRLIREKAKTALEGIVDVHPIGAVTIGRKGEQLAPLAELATAGAVGFTDDGDPVHDAEIMRRAFEYASMFQRPIIQHAQDISMTRGGVMNEGFYSTGLGLPGMPGIAEDVVIARDITLAAYTGGRYHVAHLSTSGAVALVRQAKQRNLQVTCEVTPHHFTMTDDQVQSFDTNTKMNPPLRTKADVEAIIGGLRDGTIDAIATDHAPHSFDEKQVEFQAAPFGIVGLETAVGLALTRLVHTGLISLQRLVELFSVNPRQILRLPLVKIAVGEQANMTIVQPDSAWTVDTKKFRSKSKNSPFGGFTLRGKPGGIVNNQRIYLGEAHVEQSNA